MTINVQIILIACITTLYFLLPAYLSNSGGLIFGGGKAVDGGRCDSKGNRWIGDGVTWKGLIGGTILGTLVGLIQGYFGTLILETFGQYITTPIASNMIEGTMIGFLLAFGALVGDALGSFIKRRFGIERGKPAPLLDQLDFLIVALIFVSIIVDFDWIFIAIAIALTLIIHLIANTCAYLLGIKDVWY